MLSSALLISFPPYGYLLISAPIFYVELMDSLRGFEADQLVIVVVFKLLRIIVVIGCKLFPIA